MKKQLFTLIILSFVMLASTAQQVSRELVVVEIATGTWCPYCPSAAMGADDLIANGKPVAIVEYHGGSPDDYVNAYSTARINYYSVPGFPTAYFDGRNPYVGGDGTTSNYAQYLSRVNQRVAILSSFTIDVEGTHTCLTDFNAHITVEKVDASTSTNLKLHTILTESHIEETWQGMDEVNFVCRLMAPGASGTAVSFSSGDIQEFDIPFTVNPDWVLEECEVVVFLQDNSTKEILQATKIPLLDFLPVYSYDASVKSIIDLPMASCNGIFEPTAKIRNVGSETMTSVNINYTVNGGAAQSYAWSGSLDYLGAEEVTLPAITFTGDEQNELIIYTSNPNGNDDECLSNDQKTVTIPEAMHTPNTVKLFLRTDDNPGQTTWNLKNSAGEVLFEGGPYTTAGQIIQQTFNLETEDCFTFTIYDDGGDGLVLPGLCLFYYGTNTYIMQATDFGYHKSTDFNTADPVGIDEAADNTSVEIFPNPLEDKANVMLSLNGPASVTIKVYSLTGQVVYESDEGVMEAGRQEITFDGSTWMPGLYLYQVMAGGQLFTGKLTVK
jgi:hypothetical protein